MLGSKLNYVPSIRKRLIVLVFACVFPASLLVGVLINYDYQLTYDNFIQSAMATTRANAMEVDKEFALVESGLVALSTSPDLTLNKLPAFAIQARKLVDKQNIFSIVLEDAVGQQLMNTFQPNGGSLPRDPNSPSLQFMRTQNATFISNLFVGPVAKRNMVSVGVPSKTGEGTWVALTATIATARFGTILHGQQYPDYWIASILDRNGRIVARSRDMERFVGTQMIPQVSERIRTHAEGAFETLALDGKPILAVMARAPVSGWTVVIGIPLDNLKAEMRHKLLSLVLATVCLLGAAILLAWKIGTTIRRSMRGLIAPALALGGGEPIKPTSYAVREADEVANALVKASEMLRQAQHQATHDVLTGIANRAMFYSHLERQLAQCQREGTSLSVLFLDLDNFKPINDTYGHAVGDQLLVEASRRLTSQLRKSDLAARLGGDEFAVVLMGGSTEPDYVAKKLQLLMNQPYRFGGIELSAGASIGVATFPQDGDELAGLLATADEAMYKAKASRKSAARNS